MKKVILPAAVSYLVLGLGLLISFVFVWQSYSIAKEFEMAEEYAAEYYGVSL